MLESDSFAPARWSLEYRPSKGKTNASELPKDQVSLSRQTDFELRMELMGMQVPTLKKTRYFKGSNEKGM
jgi:hypothetical protein